MPRQKKPAGTAVDKRNGRRADLAPVVTKDVQPDFPDGLCDEAKRQWELYWDSTAAGVQTQADRGVVLRWVDAVNRYLRLMGEADQTPLVKGSTGQLVANPLYAIAEKALGTVERCEKQLGIGALNRAGLGIAVLTEQKSLADMNSRYGGGGGGEHPDSDQAEAKEADPRLTVVEGEVV